MQDPIISLPKGKIQGKWIAKGTIASFKGVPYAQPPVGPLRWKAPQPLESWEGTKMATKFSPTAWQQGISLPIFLNALIDGQGWNSLHRFFVKSLLKIVPHPKESEDCLYLNVKTPKLDKQAKLPVMVWIHGGDHQDGSSSEVYYDGVAIPERDVVLVTINYRLGLMGYFAHPELKEESDQKLAGNYGTLDQIASLQWVQENIQFFGGDPGNVTIFGESAGGESVLHMLTSPLAKGLFHKAIMQSPGNGGQMSHHTETFGYIPSAEDTSLQFTELLGITGENQLEQLRKMSARDLMNMVRKDVSTFYPNVDGHVLLKSPFETIQAHEHHKVPVLLGSNANEGTCIYPIFHTPIVEYANLNPSNNQILEQLKTEFGEDLAKLYELYPGLEQMKLEAQIDLLGDSFFGAKARYYAEQITESGGQAFLYMFQRTPKSTSQTAGAFHAAELPFVHGTYTPVLPLDEQDKVLSQAMIDYWVNFAKTGNPNGENHPKWESFDVTNPQWMVLDKDKMHMTSIDRDEKYALLNKRTLAIIDTVKV